MEADKVIVFVEGGVVRSVLRLDPTAPKACHEIDFCMVDYDALAGADAEEVAESWTNFSDALKEYFAKFLPTEREMYLAAVATAKGQIK